MPNDGNLRRQRITVPLTDEEFEDVRAAAFDERVSNPEWIRRAIREALDRLEDEDDDEEIEDGEEDWDDESAATAAGPIAIYCGKCKRATESQNVVFINTENGRTLARADCADCGGSKNSFVSRTG